MGDVAARREARRRRILENSQFRLQKITGEISQWDNKTPDNTENRPQKLENLTNNGTIPKENLIDSAWDDPMEIENELIDANLGTFDGKHFIPAVSRRTWNDNASDDIDLIHREQISNDKTPFQGSKKQSDYYNSGSLLTNIFKKRSCYIFLSLFINLLMFFNLEYTFGACALIPFILVLSTRLLICDLNQQNEPPSLLFAALILLIRIDLIKRLRYIFNVLVIIYQDFAWFIFSFVIIYSISLKYLYPHHDFLSERLDATLDKQ